MASQLGHFHSRNNNIFEKNVKNLHLKSPFDSSVHLNSNNEPSRRQSKSRYVISKETQKEFGIKPNEIPITMREKLPSSFQYTNHVDQNMRVVKKYNDINKVAYLTKMKSNIQNQANSKIRAEATHNEKQIELQKKAQKWEQFKVTKYQVLNQYLAQKRKQKGL